MSSESLNTAAFELDVSHVVKALSNARLETEPFTYLVCDDVFHPDDYANIQSYFPGNSYFINVAPHVSRLDLISDPASDGKGVWEIDTRLPPDRPGHQYWYDFRNQFMTQVVMNAFVEALQLTAVPGMSCSARLAIDYLDAGLGPHTDRTDKLMSAIFYLGDESQKQFAQSAGTQVLTPKNKDQEFTQEHYKFSDFDVHEYVEYKPNRLFAFKVDNGENGHYSFHGYHQAGDFERRTIKYHIHNPRLVDNGIQENIKHKASASDWLQEINNHRNKDQ